MNKSTAISGEYLARQFAEVLGLDVNRLKSLSVLLYADEAASVRIEYVLTKVEGEGLLQVMKRYTIAEKVFPKEEGE